MSQPLFRPEVLAAKSTAEGRIQVRRSGWLAVAVSAALVLGIAIVAFLAFAGYGSRASAQGQLQPNRGLIVVQPLVSGTLESLDAAEGQRVKQGAHLALITVDPTASEGGQVGAQVAASIDDRRKATEASVTAQLAQIDQAEVALGEQIAATHTERARLQDQIRTTQQRRDLAARQRERMDSVRAKGYLSELQVQQAEADELQLVASLQALQREDAAMARTLTQLKQQLDQQPIARQSLAAQRQGDLAVLKQEGAESSSRRSRILEAPRDGMVTARLAEPGQSVQAGQPLLTLLPDGTQLEAHLLVPSRAVGFIEPGDEVRLRFQAFPFQRFGHQTGRVLRVSRSAVGADDASGDTQYRVIVALDRQFVMAFGKREALLPGMRVDADILLEDRKLYEWILEPLYALRGRLGA